MSSSDFNPEDWPAIRSAFLQLSEQYPSLEIDSLKIEAWCKKNNYSFPLWFRGLPRAALKLQKKISTHKHLMASIEMAEMASTESVSHHRSQFLKPFLKHIKRMDFPCSGAGLDACHTLAASYPNFQGDVTISDINPLSVFMAEFNLQQFFPEESFQCFAKDLTQWDLDGQNNYLFLDPARRESGQKLQKFEYLPDLDLCMRLMQQYSLAQIKLSPGENIHRLLNQYPDFYFNIIEHQKEIKEITASWISNDWLKGNTIPRVSCTILDEKSYTFQATPQTQLYPPSISYLDISQGMAIYTPRVGLFKSTLCSNWAIQSGLSQVTDAEHLFCSNEFKTDPFSQVYQFEATCSGREKDLKKCLQQHKPPGLIYRCLGTKDDSALFKICKPYLKKTKQNAWTLLLTQIGTSKRCLLLSPSN